MTHEFRMPSLGADMEAGTLVEWLKKPGDLIRRGEPIAVVDTQKGAIDIECYQEGKLLRYLVDKGTRVPVGTPLAELAETGAEGITIRGSAAASESTENPAQRLAVATPPVASPAARRLAAETGVDLSRVTGTGPVGAITSEDVEAAIGTGRIERKGVDVAEMRKAIGAAMARSKREIPHYYLAHEIDLSTARHWLTELNARRAPEQRLLMAALLLKASGLALAKYPELNGFWIDNTFRSGEAVHVGMAVAIRGGGLVAPAIHHTDTLSLDELMLRVQDNVNRARAGGLRSSELSDATATVSSLGERGVDQLYGVISPPQVAMIGFGRPRMRAWIVKAAVEPREIVTASLAADHRASDGQRGALLLAEIDRLLQQPEAL